MRIFAPVWLIIGLVSPAVADEPIARLRVHIDRIVIDDAFPNAYQVEVADVDGDGKPDLVALGGDTIAWYQNPTWTKRVIATGGAPLKGDIISSATVDLDGDGKAEIAIACDFAMNTPTRGQLWLATSGATVDAPWALRKVADVPSIHRVRWGDLDGDARPELIAAPIFGPRAKAPAYDQDPASLAAFFPGEQFRIDPWIEQVLARRPVVHAIEVEPGTKDNGSRTVIWTADALGVAAIRWDSKSRRSTTIPMIPDRGSSSTGSSSFRATRAEPTTAISEIHRGRDRLLATIEPWHGSKLVVRPYTPSDLHSGYPKAGQVIDDTLDDGHALWLADVDGDGLDEIFAGHRGKDRRVAMYRQGDKGWERTIVDTQIAAQDLRGGDLDGDGVPDVVAVGGTTHNVVWYRPSRLKGNPADASVR